MPVEVGVLVAGFFEFVGSGEAGDASADDGDAGHGFSLGGLVGRRMWRRSHCALGWISLNWMEESGRLLAQTTPIRLVSGCVGLALLQDLLEGVDEGGGVVEGWRTEELET